MVINRLPFSLTKLSNILFFKKKFNLILHPHNFYKATVIDFRNTPNNLNTTKKVDNDIAGYLPDKLQILLQTL